MEDLPISKGGTMGLLDRFRSKGRDTADQHSDQISQGIEKAGDMVDDKTGGKYADKVDTAQEKATEALAGGQDDELTTPPPPPVGEPEPPTSPATEKEPPPAP
jgi:hypothetical protein